MEASKARGLSLDVSISGFGTGLLSGIPGAFPDARIQPDLFHWMTADKGTERNKYPKNEPSDFL